MAPFHTLRVSVTDRCNLRCHYCMGPEGAPWLPTEEILTFEEITRVARAATGLGVRKVRLTGGEPLVRQWVENLVAMLAELPGLDELALTTNGVRLARQAKALKAAGLQRVTISLDSLRPGRFAEITRRDDFAKVMEGIEAALREGLTPLKINTVLLRGVNDDEVGDFVRLALKLRIEVRFIERMPLPVAAAAHENCAAPVLQSEVQQSLEREFGPLQPLPAESPLTGPARVFALGGGGARVGFISPLSEPFCRSCGRMRLTPEGKLRVCLASEEELDLKAALRRGAPDAELAELLGRAWAAKPTQSHAHFEGLRRTMSRLGG